jgi:hypothetical protein
VKEVLVGGSDPSDRWWIDSTWGMDFDKNPDNILFYADILISQHVL